MKRLLTILAAMTLSVIASAQLKVAILEPVDKAQNVSYGVKLLLRSSLTSAISNTPGYEGYDRVDMASIAGEQDFQRTGNVSDNQIKQIGHAAGAAYVLVAEAAMYDATSIIITAKLLDVETFGVKNSAVQVSGISADEMQYSCAVLSAKLLGTEPPKPVTSASAPVSTPPSQQQALQDAQRQLLEAQKQVQALAASATPTEVMLLATMSDGRSIYVATTDEPKRMNHDNAVAACACKGEGWRLPTDQELNLINASKSTIGGINVMWRYWGLEENKAMDMSLGTMIPTFNYVKAKVRCVKEVKQQ